MMAHSTDVYCSDLADNLLFHKDNYTFYRASPSLELTQDTVTRLPMSSTPNRATRNTRSSWPVISAYWDACPPITSTPCSLVTPLTASLPIANMKMVFSPSPLPVSQVPSLVFPEISPPSQGSGSTPFERQFVGDFPREWININTHISPVVRRDSHSSSFSPTISNTGGTPSGIDSAQYSQNAIGRVSLIDRFISAAADESAISKYPIPLPTSPSQDRSCSSPFSDLSDLTPLSSPTSSDRFGRELELRSSPLLTSPIVEKSKNLRKSNIRRTLDSRRESSPCQSSRSSSRSHDSDYQPAKGTAGTKRKRASRSRDGEEIPIKRKKTQTASAPESIPTDSHLSLETLTRRRLPVDIPHYPQLALLYLQFPVSSYLRLADGTFPLLSAGASHPAGTYNEPRDALDLYTPRFVKGCGATKVGVCPICIESASRSGKGEVVWLSMKFSAYKWHVPGSALTSSTHFTLLTDYHLQYAHGISSISARPFSPPVAFRTTERHNPAKNERTRIQEGKCHKCQKWVPVESIKNIDIKVKELYWWKHAATCHQGANMEGDDDFFQDDDIYRRAQQLSDRDS